MARSWHDEVARAGRLLFFTAAPRRTLLAVRRDAGTEQGESKQRATPPGPDERRRDALLQGARPPPRPRARSWWSDGTGAGTKLVKDIVPGHGGREYRAAARVLREALLHGGRRSPRARKFWRSNGTSAGTRLFKEIEPGKRGLKPPCPAGVGRKFVFTAWRRCSRQVPAMEVGRDALGDEARHGRRGGARLRRGSGGPRPSPARLLLPATDGGVWRTDGTRSGTERVLEEPGTASGRSPLLHRRGGNPLLRRGLWPSRRRALEGRSLAGPQAVPGTLTRRGDPGAHWRKSWRFGGQSRVIPCL